MRASANNLSVFFCYQKWGKDDFFRHCAALRQFSALKRGDDSGFFAKMIRSRSQSHRFLSHIVSMWNALFFYLFQNRTKKGKIFFAAARPTVDASLRQRGCKRHWYQAPRHDGLGSRVNIRTYLRVKGMLKVIQSPAKYLQGPDASTLFGQYAKNLADSFFVIADDFVMKLAG